MDLEVSAALTIPAAELQWKFSRSSGAGGQHVNTSDSRVQLTWSVLESAVLSDEQRQVLLNKIGPTITTTVSARRSQLQNRQAALGALSKKLGTALAPAGPKRRPTRPTRGSSLRRLSAKSQRSSTKQTRQRPGLD